MHGDLEQFLHAYSELVLIHVRDDNCEGSLYMDRLMQELERTSQIPVLRLRFTEYHEWAHGHGIYGTPAIVAYHAGRLVFRLIGRVTPDELAQHLRDAGL